MMASHQEVPVDGASVSTPKARQMAMKIAKKAMNQVEKRVRKSKSMSNPQSTQIEVDVMPAKPDLRVPWEVLGVKTHEVVLDRGDHAGYILDALGFQLSTVMRDRCGPQITSVTEGGAAAAAGITKGHVILEVNGKVVYFSLPHEVVLAISMAEQEVHLKLADPLDDRLQSDSIEHYRPVAELDTDDFANPDDNDTQLSLNEFVPSIELRDFEDHDDSNAHSPSVESDQLPQDENSPAIDIPESKTDVSKVVAVIDCDSKSHDPGQDKGKEVDVLETLVEPKREASKAQVAWQRALDEETENPGLIVSANPGNSSLNGSAENGSVPTKSAIEAIVLKGSKTQSDKMGTYIRHGEHVNNKPVYKFKHPKVKKELYLFFFNKNWRVAKSTRGGEKCFIRTASPVNRPDLAKTVWYEAKSSGGMQANAGIKAELKSIMPKSLKLKSTKGSRPIAAKPSKMNGDIPERNGGQSKETYDADTPNTATCPVDTSDALANSIDGAPVSPVDLSEEFSENGTAEQVAVELDGTVTQPTQQEVQVQNSVQNDEAEAESNSALQERAPIECSSILPTETADADSAQDMTSGTNCDNEEEDPTTNVEQPFPGSTEPLNNPFPDSSIESVTGSVEAQDEFQDEITSQLNNSDGGIIAEASSDSVFIDGTTCDLTPFEQPRATAMDNSKLSHVTEYTHTGESSNADTVTDDAVRKNLQESDISSLHQPAQAEENAIEFTIGPCTPQQTSDMLNTVAGSVFNVSDTANESGATKDRADETDAVTALSLANDQGNVDVTQVAQRAEKHTEEESKYIEATEEGTSLVEIIATPAATPPPPPVPIELPEPSDIDRLVEEHRAKAAKSSGKKKKSKSSKKKNHSNSEVNGAPVKLAQKDIVPVINESNTPPNEIADLQSPPSTPTSAKGSGVNHDLQMSPLDMNVATPATPKRVPEMSEIAEMPPTSPKNTELIDEWKQMHSFLEQKLAEEGPLSDSDEDDTLSNPEIDPVNALVVDQAESDAPIAATHSAELDVMDQLFFLVKKSIPPGLRVETRFVEKSPKGFGFHVRMPGPGQDGMSITHLITDSPAAKASLPIGHVLVAVNDIQLLEKTTLQQLSAAVTEAGNSSPVDGVVVTTCSVGDLMSFKYASANGAQPQEYLGDIPSSPPVDVTDAKTSVAAPVTPSTPVNPHLYAEQNSASQFTESIPSRIETLDVVKAKMEAQLNQAKEFGLDEESVTVLKDEVERLDSERTTLLSRPPAILRTLSRANSVDGNTFGFEVYMCPRAETCRICNIDRGSAADAAGLKTGDVLMDIDGVDAYKVTEPRCLSLIAQASDVLKLGIIPNADVEVLPLKALRELTAKERITSVYSDIKAAPGISSYLFGPRLASPARTPERASASRRLFSDANADGQENGLGRTVVESLSIAADEAEHKFRSAWRRFVELAEPTEDDSAYASIFETADARKAQFSGSLRQIQLPPGMDKSQFEVKQRSLAPDVQILQFLWKMVPLKSLGETVQSNDILLVVDERTILGDTANAALVELHITTATSPISMTVVDEMFIYDIPESKAELEALIYQPQKAEAGVRELWRQFKQWQGEIAQSKAQPKVVEQCRPVKLVSDATRLQASSSLIGPKICVACRARPKEILLGCNHCLCSECAEKSHACPIVGCGRIIVSRKKVHHMFRSAMEQPQFKSPATTQKSPGDTGHKRVRDSGVGAIAGGWEVAKIGDGSGVSSTPQRSPSGSKTSKKRSSRVVNLQTWERSLPSSQTQFEHTTEV